MIKTKGLFIQEYDQRYIELLFSFLQKHINSEMNIEIRSVG